MCGGLCEALYTVRVELHYHGSTLILNCRLNQSDCKFARQQSFSLQYFGIKNL